jgi:hypothetical protein
LNILNTDYNRGYEKTRKEIDMVQTAHSKHMLKIGRPQTSQGEERSRDTETIGKDAAESRQRLIRGSGNILGNVGGETGTS